MLLIYSTSLLPVPGARFCCCTTPSNCTRCGDSGVTTSTAGTSVILIRVMFACNDVEILFSQPSIQWKALFCFFGGTPSKIRATAHCIYRLVDGDMSPSFLAGVSEEHNQRCTMILRFFLLRVDSAKLLNRRYDVFPTRILHGRDCGRSSSDAVRQCPPSYVFTV